jgi:hypothetical protein
MILTFLLFRYSKLKPMHILFFDIQQNICTNDLVTMQLLYIHMYGQVDW